MRELLRRIRMVHIHHLIRYFILLSPIIFIGFVRQIYDPVFTYLIGPPLYLAFWLKKLVVSSGANLPRTDLTDHLFLFPVTVVYYGLTAFQLKQLWNERGFVRSLSLLALAGFLVYVHYMSGKNLIGYSLPNP